MARQPPATPAGCVAVEYWCIRCRGRFQRTEPLAVADRPVPNLRPLCRKCGRVGKPAPTLFDQCEPQSSLEGVYREGR